MHSDVCIRIQCNGMKVFYASPPLDGRLFYFDHIHCTFAIRSVLKQWPIKHAANHVYRTDLWIFNTLLIDNRLKSMNGHKNTVPAYSSWSIEWPTKNVNYAIHPHVGHSWKRIYQQQQTVCSQMYEWKPDQRSHCTTNQPFRWTWCFHVLRKKSWQFSLSLNLTAWLSLKSCSAAIAASEYKYFREGKSHDERFPLRSLIQNLD